MILGNDMRCYRWEISLVLPKREDTVKCFIAVVDIGCLTVCML